MAVFVRAKRVTGVLDDKVKARLTGYVSSGSEHDAADLSGLIDGFFLDTDEDNDTFAAASAAEVDEKTDGSDDGHRSSSPFPAAAMIRDLLSSAEDGFRTYLVADVSEAAESVSSFGIGRSAFLRAVMESLRESGYNAGLCKARWESSGGITGGSHEYIDVIKTSPAAASKEVRYIVDVDFATQFEIARPTAEYWRVAAALPPVLVGRAEELKQALKLVAEAARRSLKTREMHVPPWRKARYMQAKWLGPYRRTTNAVPLSASCFGPGREVQCRSVGFDAATLVVPPATRTR